MLQVRLVLWLCFADGLFRLVGCFPRSRPWAPAMHRLRRALQLSLVVVLWQGVKWRWVLPVGCGWCKQQYKPVLAGVGMQLGPAAVHPQGRPHKLTCHLLHRLLCRSQAAPRGDWFLQGGGAEGHYCVGLRIHAVLKAATTLPCSGSCSQPGAVAGAPRPLAEAPRSAAPPTPPLFQLSPAFVCSCNTCNTVPPWEAQQLIGAMLRGLAQQWRLLPKRRHHDDDKEWPLRSRQKLLVQTAPSLNVAEHREVPLGDSGRA